MRPVASLKTSASASPADAPLIDLHECRSVPRCIKQWLQQTSRLVRGTIVWFSGCERQRLGGLDGWMDGLEEVCGCGGSV